MALLGTIANVVCIIVGSVVGMFLTKTPDQFGQWVASRFTNNSSDVNIAQAFITASLLFVIGAMAILGSLDSGLRGDHEILYTKSILDGFSSFVLASTLGIGVILSVIPVGLIQGSITLLANKIENLIPDAIFDIAS